MSKIKIFSLGGLNELGKNMYIVEVDNDIYVFDAGLKYAEDKMLGVDYIIPNYDYLKANKKRIKGLFITHGHNEQTGAIADMLVDLPDMPIYATAFTVEMLKRELINESLSTVNLHEIKVHHKIKIGSCYIFPISLTHSVPDNVGYVLYTDQGAIFYTGNFVFDPTMLGCYKTDIGKLAYVGKQGVLCLLSESSYADKLGFTSPNHRIRQMISETLNRSEGRVLFNVLQAQLYRIQELFDEIMKTDRKIIILGKELQEILIHSIDTGYVKFDKKRIMKINGINEENVVIIVSDEREKPFSNLKRIAKGYDKFVKLKETDTILFASPVYDGNEKTAAKLFDVIAQTGANLVNLPTKKYLSHHASSEDLMLMLDLMKPKYYFPVIGEYRHQVANVEIARKIGMKDENILLKLNGQVVTFIDSKVVSNNEIVKTDEILIDGKTVGDIGELVLKDREALSDNGIVLVTVTLNRETKEILAGPEIMTRGFIYVKDNIDLIKEARKLSLQVVKTHIKPNYVDFNKIKSGIRDKVGTYFYKETECRPMILVVMQEV
ncbi:MAG: ribonuclease J [Bacilli bacterium]